MAWKVNSADKILKFKVKTKENEEQTQSAPREADKNNLDLSLTDTTRATQILSI